MSFQLGDRRFELGKHALFPLVIGGMGVDISTSALALEAARLGGIGHISDAMAPYLSDRSHGTHFQRDKLHKFEHLRKSIEKPGVAWDPEAVYQAQINHVRSTMDKRKGDGLVFVNVMEKLTMGSPRETLAARLKGVLDGGIDGITLSAGLHNGTMKLIEDHPRLRDAYIGIIVSSARALKIFLKSAARVDRLPDYIVVEGPLAGGHLGFGLDWMNYNLRDIVSEVLTMLREENLQIPVIPAGGVFTGADAMSFLEMGASAVQVATRFTISRECGFPTLVKQHYLTSQEEDVEVNLSSPTGYPMRMLKSSPSLRSNVRPNCEALGYILDGNGNCAYHKAYHNTGFDEKGRKLPVVEKMCICHQFMRYQCYTCGHNVFRLKDTTYKMADGSFYLPTAEEVFKSYLWNTKLAPDALPTAHRNGNGNGNGKAEISTFKEGATPEQSEQLIQP